MALLIDAGVLYAHTDEDEPRHRSVATFLDGTDEALVTTELVLAEADYLILKRLGPEAESLFLHDLAEGTYLSTCLSSADLRTAEEVVNRYRDLRLGLADASLVVAAKTFETNRILTFDERAFRAITPLQGGAFQVLPADQPR